MTPLDFTGFSNRKPLSKILSIPAEVQSVYSLGQHVWAGTGAEARNEAKKKGQVRLETLDEFLVDPVRGYLNRIFERIADNEGQGWWLQAEFGVGKSHLLAVTSILALGGTEAWDRIKQREDEEKKAGPGARVDSLWRKKLEKRKIFPIVFSLEGVGGTVNSRLEDFILEEAQSTFTLRHDKPLAVYPEEHLANLYLRDHQARFKDDVRRFLADKRLMRGLATFQYDDFIQALKRPESQRDAGRVLYAFFRHVGFEPRVPYERGERLNRMVDDILGSGYDGIFIVIDEMSEYLRKASQNTADDEDCLLVLANSLAKVQSKPIWTLVAAQMAHTNPQKIIAPDRLSQETLEHKPERFRDIVVQRTRTITDRAEVKVYFDGYHNLIPWVKESAFEDFEGSFPFPPDALGVIRSISTKLTGTRSTIGFLHRSLKNASQNGVKDLVPLWRVFDDLMSYNETPSTSSTGTVSIRSRFREEVSALEAAQNTLKRITDGQLARAQNKTRAERILNTLFLYHLAGVAGLTNEQILDAVSDIKAGEEELEAQIAHYETLLEEMRGKLRNQIRVQAGRYEFTPRETSQYDDLVYQAADKLNGDPQLLDQMTSRLMAMVDPEIDNQFSPYISEAEGRQTLLKVEDWHGQERSGRVRAINLASASHTSFDIDTHSAEDDFLILCSWRAVPEKQLEAWLKKTRVADPRLVVWAPAQLSKEERSILAGVLAHLKVSEDYKNSNFAKDGRREFKRDAHRAYAVLYAIYGRGAARTSRGSVDVSLVGGIEGALKSMAKAAMETCYRSREIDFGNRKFDSPNAVKLINGLVKRGMAVSEGDVLWSAVENFASPLGLVRPEAPKRLDPNASDFYKEIRAKVEELGGVGIEVKTVYNWFTGYSSSDGNESAGLTRRMVDVYLMCLAQQGVIRISQGKGAGWIDRATISSIDFKPETLRGLSRIELPRALEDWEVFHAYLETLTEKAENSLGPKYDKATSDEALHLLWAQKFIDRVELQRVDHEVHELFTALGQDEKHPFDELLIYWMEFAGEPKPELYSDDECFDWLRRSVLKASGVSQVDELGSAQLSSFKENYRRLKELLDSFKQTSMVLILAAKMASAPLPDGSQFQDIRRAQQEVLKELDDCERIILNPDIVSVRLKPRLSKLEQSYVDPYLDELMRLGAIQGQLIELSGKIPESAEFSVLADFSTDVPEAKRIADGAKGQLGAVPNRLRRSPEDRDKAEKEVRLEAKVKDLQSQDLTFRRLRQEYDARLAAHESLKGVAASALTGFADFLMSPGVAEQLKMVPKPPKELVELSGAKSTGEMCEMLLTMPSKDRQELAKLLKVAIGKKRAKTISLRSFNPKCDVVWDRDEVARLVRDFEEFIAEQWEDGTYLRIE
jgi:hypothetical protein